MFLITLCSSTPQKLLLFPCKYVCALFFFSSLTRSLIATERSKRFCCDISSFFRLPAFSFAYSNRRTRLRRGTCCGKKELCFASNPRLFWWEREERWNINLSYRDTPRQRKGERKRDRNKKKLNSQVKL